MRHFASVIEEPPVQEARTSSVLDPARAVPASPATTGSYTRCACASDGLLGWWVGWQDGEWDDEMVSGGWKQTPRLER